MASLDALRATLAPLCCGSESEHHTAIRQVLRSIHLLFRYVQ